MTNRWKLPLGCAGSLKSFSRHHLPWKLHSTMWWIRVVGGIEFLLAIDANPPLQSILLESRKGYFMRQRIIDGVKPTIRVAVCQPLALQLLTCCISC